MSTVLRKPLATRLPSSIPSSNLPSAAPAHSSHAGLKKPTAVAYGPSGLLQPKSLIAAAPVAAAKTSVSSVPAAGVSKLPQRSTALPLPSAIPAPSGIAAAARSAAVASSIPSFSFARSAASESPANSRASSRASSPVRAAAPSPVPDQAALLSAAASTPFASAAPAVLAAFVVAAVNEDDLAAILAAEEERELDEAAEAVAAAAAAAAPAADPCSGVALPACFTEADAAISFEPAAVEHALPLFAADPCVVPSAAACDLAPAASTPVLCPRSQSHAEQAAAAEDNDDELAAAEEDGFGLFAIPEADPTLAPAAAVTTARVVRAPPRPDVSVSSPFPYELDCSEATVARRADQILAAQNQAHSLQAEIDLYASKLFQLAQMAAQPQYAQLSLSQLLLDALSGDSSDESMDLGTELH